MQTKGSLSIFPSETNLANWQAPTAPPLTILTGRYCRLEPLDASRHGGSLYQTCCCDGSEELWRYLPYGPFADEISFERWLKTYCRMQDKQFYAIVDQQSGKAIGLAAYLRIAPQAGSIEVGNLYFSPLLQRTRMATEAMYLMMKYAFKLGYRRYEWKCNGLNLPSRAAASRLGFEYEGTFRQAAVIKGQNRDTAWFSILDCEWSALKLKFEAWLQLDNFDQQAQQKQGLGIISKQ